MLTSANFKDGFLIDEEAIAGVTEMAGGIYAAYVSHYMTGETFAYQEFDALGPALDFLNSMPRAWSFEGVGCGSKKTNAGCGTCATGGCGSSGGGCG